jgi:hypothetical protein
MAHMNFLFEQCCGVTSVALCKKTKYPGHHVTLIPTKGVCSTPEKPVLALQCCSRSRLIVCKWPAEEPQQLSGCCN